MAPPRTRIGTRKLSDVAQRVVVPSGIVTTGYPAVRDKCRELGIIHDDWQQGLGRLILGKREDGKYAATVGGVGLSIPRQVGKTFTIGSILFALCILFPNMLVLWTAHRTRTANETFRAMQGMARRSKIKPHIAYVRATNGEQEIGFRNGSRILFGAREQGFGRGFAAVDVEVFDEAQILTDKALEDMVAATNQSRHPHGALLFFMGTPPRPIDPGEAFTRMRVEAMSGESRDVVWVELSADADADPDDWGQVAKANPSYPDRTPAEAILRMRKRLSLESFLREGLGIWDDDAQVGGVFGSAWVDARRDSGKKPPKPSAIGLAASVDRATGSIAGASLGKHGVLLGAVERRDGVTWMVAEAARIQRKHGCLVVIDGKGPAADLVPLLSEAGVTPTVASTAEYLDACAQVYDGIREGAVVHADHSDLNAAASGSTWRNVGDRRAFGRRSGDISMLEAAALAGWAAALSNYDAADSIY